MTTTVETRSVAGRRKLSFGSLEEILADAERVAAGPHRTLGNWTAGQVFRHLATVMNGAIDGVPTRPPWYIRTMARLMKKWILSHTMRAGIKLPPDAAAHLVPPATTTEDGLNMLRRAIHRLQTETKREPSPFLGPLTRAEYDQLQMRHAELHLSFLVPE